ncbi:hypothetical protein CHS0354_040490 [Potamilus streckersoni]|uniref:EGF-like domain-containing protein n=1 Tax=Potamilus streckersoni TaxID=2493646 RepID=A0AAE0WF54_9BIVA|nr:hypothetical protein CHS0354_040490 [Potamilus streckersoni]
MTRSLQNRVLLVTWGILFGTAIGYDGGLILTLSPLESATRAYIKAVPTDANGAPDFNSTKTLNFAANLWLSSVGGDYALRQVYAYELYSSTIYKISNFSINMSGGAIRTSVHIGLSKDYVKLAVDWISHNIYWTDPHYKWIVVQSLAGNDTSMFRILIDDNLEKPHALTLDPMEGLLFWSDIGRFTKIEVSSLSGKNRKSLISSNLVMPISLAADYGARRIYWVDSGRYTLESITYEGKERKIILRDSNHNFHDLALYKDYLYVTDSYQGTLSVLNKTNGMNLKTIMATGGATYYGVTVFHPDAQPRSVTAYCVNYGCDHICLTEKSGASCVCRDGYILNQDMKTCSVSNKYFHRGLVFSNDSSICIVDIRVLTKFAYSPTCVLNTNGTKYMVMDTDQRQIIIANDTSIYWAMVDNLELHVLTKQSGAISGLTWDGYERNVYWSENDTGRIWKISRESGTASLLISGLIRPRDIVILPHERLLYWISDRNGSTIEYSNLDGSNQQVLLDSTYLRKPKSLSYDIYKKRIYFLDMATAGINYVYSCKLDGSDLTKFISTFAILDKLALYKGHLLLTSKKANGTLVMSYSIDHVSITTSGKFSGAGNISSIKVFDETFRENETGPCYKGNGGCEQICLSSGMSSICECTFGFRLAPNGKNCVSDPIKDNFVLIEDSTHNNIYQISLIDETIQGINAKGTVFLTGITYSPVHDLVIWATDYNEISMIHLNGTGQHTFLIMEDNIDVYPNGLALDISTGNIYYAAVSYMEDTIGYQSHIGVLLPNGKHKVILTRLSVPQGLVVYPSKGLLFYIDNGYNAYIGKANMDGTEASVLLETFNDRMLTELTIDYKNDYLYWLDYTEGSICYCKLDGTNYKTLVNYPNAILSGLALYQDNLYVTNEEYSSMIKVKISNPNETTKFAAYGELGSIGYISIYSSMVQDKNTFCSVGNGGCSTFCFPTPSGGLCACEDGVQLKDGSDTFCSNIPQCPVMEGAIIVSADCQRVDGSKCNFTCTQGYNARQGVKNVLCNGFTYTPADSCEASPAMLLAGKSEVDQAAIGYGVAIGVFVVIIIIVLTVFIILRRRKRNTAFSPERMQNEVMNATFGFEPNNEYAQVSYEKDAAHIIDSTKQTNIKT